MLPLFPTTLSSSHCFSYTNFPASLQTHQAAAQSHLRASALTFLCIWNISPSQPNYLHGIPHLLQICLHVTFIRESFPYHSHSSLSFLFPYTALYFSIAYITICHIFIGLFIVDSWSWDITSIRAGTSLRIVSGI